MKLSNGFGLFVETIEILILQNAEARKKIYGIGPEQLWIHSDGQKYHDEPTPSKVFTILLVEWVAVGRWVSMGPFAIL